MLIIIDGHRGGSGVTKVEKKCNTDIAMKYPLIYSSCLAI